MNQIVGLKTFCLRIYWSVYVCIKLFNFTFKFIAFVAFNKILKAEFCDYGQELSFKEKLDIIKSFLEDKKIFARIIDIINFANEELSLNFKDQKESRGTTVKRIIGRIEETPELKEKVKSAVTRIKNSKSRDYRPKMSKREMEKAKSYARWAEILTNL